jgi:hypothetical protein
MTSPIKHASYLHITFFLLITISLSFHSTAAKAEVYKWTDKNGNTHYSDIKPNETRSEKLDIKVNQPSQDRASPQESALKLDTEKAKELELQAEKLQSETKKRELNAQCQNMRDNLKTLQENSRIKINENGKIRQMTPKEIESKKQIYIKQINDLCTK